MAGRKKNYLEFVPVHNPKYRWEEKESGLVTVTVVHTGFYNWLAQKLFHTPVYSDIDLDTFGSFVWKQINGDRSVYEIAALVKAEFGKQAEPLYERLVKYVQILRNNRFVLFQKELKPIDTVDHTRG